MASNYFPKNGYPVSQRRLDPIARVLLIGVYNDKNALSIFRGMRYIIKEIWELTIQFNQHFYSPYIHMKLDEIDPYYAYSYDTLPAAFDAINKWNTGSRCDATLELDYQLLKFPKSLEKEVNINMMPILMNPLYLNKQIPEELKGYIPWIRACLLADPSQSMKICFLTIHESFVEKGKTQRRPGLHCELPGVGVGGTGEWQFRGWGEGYNRKDGIFIASNISDSCAVWNCRIIEKDDSKDDTVKVMDSLGGLEHLRGIMPKNKRYSLEGGKLYWITDRTPHESLPMMEDGWRQFFRLVSSKLGIWYDNHSTKNPVGIVPDPNITKIIKGNKFKRKY